MDCDACFLDHANLYGDVAFRLPSLKQKHNELVPLYKEKVCPREARVTAAFESRDKKKRTEASFVSRTTETKLFSITNAEGDDVQSYHARNEPILQNSLQAVEFIFRELTEVSEAIEKSKDRLREETIQGLRRIISGVLHSMGQEILRTAFSSHISNVRYENFSQAVPLSPRYLRKLEKREPIVRTPQVCRGCQVGGRLPWIYLYPDREVYRTGGGFDCVEFQLPAIKSDKPTTKPEDPFSKNRGKLVETKQHRLPRKRKHRSKYSSKKPVTTDHEKQRSEFYLEIPGVTNSYSSLSSISDMDQRNTEDTSGTSTGLSRNGLAKLSPLAPSSSPSEAALAVETLNEIPKEQQEPRLLNPLKKLKEVSFESEINKPNRDDSNDDHVEESSDCIDLSTNHSQSANHKIDEHKFARQTQSLHKRLSNLSKQQPTTASETKLLSDDSKFARKFITRSSVQTVSPYVFTAVHHSTMLSDKPVELPPKIPISRMRKSPSKIHGFGKKKTQDTTSIAFSINSSRRSRTASSIMTSLSDMSFQFSSSLSLSNPDVDGEDGAPKFSLTCAQVKPSERKQSTAKKFSAPGFTRPSLQAISKPGKVRVKKQDETSDQRNDSNSSLQQISLLGQSESDCGSSMMYTQDDCFENTNNISLSSGLGSEMVSFEKSESLDEEQEMDNFFDNLSQYDNNPEASTQDWEQQEMTSSNQKRRKAKRKRTLQFRMEPLSKYTLKRGSRKESEVFEDEEEEDDLSMLDYAARYCIISLERLSKYENIFNTFASREMEIGSSAVSKTNKFDAGITGNTDKQKSLLKEFEKLVFGMDVYQQKISGVDKKRVDLIYEQQDVYDILSGDGVDEERKKLLEASIHTLSSRIAASEDNMKQLIGKLKKMMERKKEIQDSLMESGMEKEKVDELIRNTDFLERRFIKMKNQQIKVEHLPAALKVLNRKFDDEDFAFISHVLQLPRKESLDFKAFAVVAALAEGVKSLDKSIKALLRQIDLSTLERKLDKCKELYRLLAEEHPDNGKRLVSIDNLAVELRAGGLQHDQQKSVIDRLNHNGHGFLDFIDFVLYVPLFLMIHDQIVGQPFV